MKGNLLTKMGTAYTSPKNACRTIRRLIKRTAGVSLNLPVCVCEVHVRLRKPIRALRVHWPVLRMNDWVQYLIAHKPGLLLAGHDIGGDWQRTFTEFWAGYKEVDGSHPVFREGFDLGGCIPYHLHGDEGRGQLKRPYMVLSWQCLIGHQGPQTVNDTTQFGVDWSAFSSLCLFVCRHVGHVLYFIHVQVCVGGCACTCTPPKVKLLGHKLAGPTRLCDLRHSFCSRWLFTGISSHLYYQTWTIDDIMTEFAKSIGSFLLRCW